MKHLRASTSRNMISKSINCRFADLLISGDVIKSDSQRSIFWINRKDGIPVNTQLNKILFQQVRIVFSGLFPLSVIDVPDCQGMENFRRIAGVHAPGPYRNTLDQTIGLTKFSARELRLGFRNNSFFPLDLYA